jgi:hypothetical protein
MNHLFDEFSKSLSESVPRRESLRRLGAAFAGAILSPLGLETAWAGKVDPCKAFCQCRNSQQQSQCLDACKKCNGNTGRLVGTCGNYACCAIAACKGVCSNLKADPNCGACGNNCRAYGETCCGSYCADPKNDVFNCGRCGTACPPPSLNEDVACVAGTCVYDCVEGAADCGNGVCTDLMSDPDNCSACGNTCGGETPYCGEGVCTDCGGYGVAMCNGVCVNILSDSGNCGACGVECAADELCTFGVCYGTCSGC